MWEWPMWSANSLLGISNLGRSSVVNTREGYTQACLCLSEDSCVGYIYAAMKSPLGRKVNETPGKMENILDFTL